MSTTITRTGIGDAIVAQELFTVTGATEWVLFKDCTVTAQIGGTATACTAVVERSAVNPGTSGSAAVASPAASTPMSGDLTAGVAPNTYTESGVGWWRIRVSTLTGGNVTAVLSGKSL